MKALLGEANGIENVREVARVERATAALRATGGA